MNRIEKNMIFYPVEDIPKTKKNKFYPMPATSAYGSALSEGKTHKEALELASKARYKATLKF